MLTRHFLLTTIFFFALFSCNDSDDGNQNGKINSEARALNDSACVLSQSGKVKDIQKAVELLDSATSLDKNYFTAYWNKLAFLNVLKRYDRSLETAKHLNRLKPNDPMFYVTIGTLYEKKNDSISANDYFQQGLALFNSELDTMNHPSKKYDFMLMNKGIDLIMLGNERDGNLILQQLYESSSDSAHRKTLAFYMNKNKKEILDSLEKFNHH